MGNHPLFTKDWLGVPSALRSIRDLVIMVKGLKHDYDKQNEMVRVEFFWNDTMKDDWVLLRRSAIISVRPSINDGQYVLTTTNSTYWIMEEEFIKHFHQKE